MNRNDFRLITRLQPAKVPETVGRSSKRQHRERDFGIGYGNSSGYGRATRYVDGWTGAPRFRCG